MLQKRIQECINKVINETKHHNIQYPKISNNNKSLVSNKKSLK